MITKDQIITACGQIQDPEIFIDVYTLGLIYDIQITENNEVYILMTYTSAFCPFGERMKNHIYQEVEKLQPQSIEIEVTFDPPWQPSQELRELLGV